MTSTYERLQALQINLPEVPPPIARIHRRLSDDLTLNTIQAAIP